MENPKGAWHQPKPDAYVISAAPLMYPPPTHVADGYDNHHCKANKCDKDKEKDDKNKIEVCHFWRLIDNTQISVVEVPIGSFFRVVTHLLQRIQNDFPTKVPFWFHFTTLKILILMLISF